MNREERDSLIGTMTTLCYLEKDDSYLMLHRVKKKNDVNQDKWIVSCSFFSTKSLRAYSSP